MSTTILKKKPLTEDSPEVLEQQLGYRESELAAAQRAYGFILDDLAAEDSLRRLRGRRAESAARDKRDELELAVAELKQEVARAFEVRQRARQAPARAELAAALRSIRDVLAPAVPLIAPAETAFEKLQAVDRSAPGPALGRIGALLDSLNEQLLALEHGQDNSS